MSKPGSDSKTVDRRQMAGWIAVGVSTVITCFWAFWGIIENFHEGWYYESFFSKVGLMFLQYLSPMMIFMGVTLLSIFWPRFGGSLHALSALGALRFFHTNSNTAIALIILPFLGLAVLYWVGRPKPRRLVGSLVTGLPLLILIVSGISPAIRIAQRIHDGNVQLYKFLEMACSSPGHRLDQAGQEWEGIGIMPGKHAGI